MKMKKKFFFSKDKQMIKETDILSSAKNRADHIKYTTLVLSSNCNSFKDNIDLDKEERVWRKSMPD